MYSLPADDSNSMTLWALRIAMQILHSDFTFLFYCRCFLAFPMEFQVTWFFIPILCGILLVAVTMYVILSLTASCGLSIWWYFLCQCLDSNYDETINVIWCPTWISISVLWLWYPMHIILDCLHCEQILWKIWRLRHSHSPIIMTHCDDWSVWIY